MYLDFREMVLSAIARIFRSGGKPCCWYAGDGALALARSHGNAMCLGSQLSDRICSASKITRREILVSRENNRKIT
ncbi:MAG: hypothetical protein SAL70_02505 [Scytonema sp. PMC 1070.18]|nr:hypothetical protein [Scytonema sp. PMC 1070.18]